MSEPTEQSFGHPRHRLLGCAAALAALTVAVSLALSAAAHPAGATAAYATLGKAPTGYASLLWNPQTRSLSVRMWMSGLAPNSVHPAHIHTGNCASTGGIEYSLPTVSADSVGRAALSATISGVAGGIPAAGWDINVHNGPGMSTFDQFEPILCGNIVNQNTNPADSQYAATPLGATPAPNQDAWGGAQLWVDSSNLYVRLQVGGLAPHSVHAAHIHAGSCTSQGTVVHPLKTVVADANGYSDETTVIPGVSSIPYSGWYVNVHRSTDLSTQTGYDPIACGDVYPG